MKIYVYHSENQQLFRKSELIVLFCRKCIWMKIVREWRIEQKQNVDTYVDTNEDRKSS